MKSIWRSLFITTMQWSLFLAVLVSATIGQSAGPRVFPQGKVPQDRRLGDLTNLNGFFPFKVPSTKAAWEERASQLRLRVQVATGLWPLPERTPLNAVVHGRVERPGFTVEKVYFESVPEHFVTGLLFRPSGKKGKLPAVLCPHGHGGRLQDHGADGIRQFIVQGHERFEGSGRFPKIARCAQLARMGCVTFIYDMVGYADSVQIPHRLRPDQRPIVDTKERWGLYSTQAELRLQSMMALQTWNSIRALDFLCSLPDVDARRLGVTGGSGGGTQTILVGALDSRPVVSFPQGMVSTSMQGGCTCENCCLLRVGTGNVELTALFAPRPQAMTAADDWTKEMMTSGYPQLQALYGMLGVQDRVLCKSLTHFPHNYNYVTRAVMYSWFNKYLNLGLTEPIVEEDWEPLANEEKTVWNQDHPQPTGGVQYELDLMRYLSEVSDRQLARLVPANPAELREYRRVVGNAFRVILNNQDLASDPLQREKRTKTDRGDYYEFTDLVRKPSSGQELPVVSLFPKQVQWNKQVVVWVDGIGKAGLYDETDKPRAPIQTLLNGGAAVMAADLIYQGEFLVDGKTLQQSRTVSTSPYAGYTHGYNDSVFVQRTQDLLTLIAWGGNDEHGADAIHLVGVNGAGPLVAAARSQAGKQVQRAAIDTQGFRFVDLKSFRDVNFLPGAVKYGDLPGLLALSAPHRLWIAGEAGGVPQLARQAFAAAGVPEQIEAFNGPATAIPVAIANWLLAD